MYATKAITKDEAQKALKTPLKLRNEYVSYSQNKAPYFSDYVMRELVSLGFSEDEITSMATTYCATKPRKRYKKKIES